jgi:hypothetical protein
VQGRSGRAQKTSLKIPWATVNQTRLTVRPSMPKAVPTPHLAPEVQRGSQPGCPGANYRC